MNNPKNQISVLLNRELTRSEFLKLIGASILGVIGVTSLLQNLTISTQPTTDEKPSGYGDSPYGR